VRFLGYELDKEGLSEEAAYSSIIASIDVLDEVIAELDVDVKSEVRSNLNFSAGSFKDIDLSMLNKENLKFNSCNLKEIVFANAEINHSRFKACKL